MKIGKATGFQVRIGLRGTCWVMLRKRGSTKFWFLFQWSMPGLQHFIINER